MSINATEAITGIRPNIVTVLESHPVVFALNTCENPIGSSIPASNATIKMLITPSPSATKKSLPSNFVTEDTS